MFQVVLTALVVAFLSERPQVLPGVPVVHRRLELVRLNRNGHLLRLRSSRVHGRRLLLATSDVRCRVEVCYFCVLGAHVSAVGPRRSFDRLGCIVALNVVV